MPDLSDLKRGQIVDASMAGVSATKPAELFGVSRDTVSKVMTLFEKKRIKLLTEEKLRKNAKAV